MMRSFVGWVSDAERRVTQRLSLSPQERWVTRRSASLTQPTALAALLTLALASPALAQFAPSRPLEIVAHGGPARATTVLRGRSQHCSRRRS